MGQLLEIVTPLHKSTKRDYLARMIDEKVHCMLKAKETGKIQRVGLTNRLLSVGLTILPVRTAPGRVGKHGRSRNSAARSFSNILASTAVSSRASFGPLNPPGAICPFCREEAMPEERS